MVASSSSLESFLTSDNVPTLPEIALRVVRIAQEPDPDMKELVRTIRADPAISARLLKFANSALFGLRCPATSIEGVIPVLGTSLVRTLTLGFILANETAVSESLVPWFQRLWRESLFEASAAELFAEESGTCDPPTAFLTGLLQDIGQLVMLNVCQVDYYRHVLERGRTECRRQLEENYFGFSHVDVSVALAERWNLDSDMVLAIAAHHETAFADDRPLRFVAAAASSCSEYMEAHAERVAVTREAVVAHLLLGYEYSVTDVPEKMAEIDSRSHELAAGFAVDIGQPQSREQILMRAQRALSNIAVESQLLLSRQIAD